MDHDILETFPTERPKRRKILERAALPGCLFNFNASLYFMHGEHCESNILRWFCCGNVAYPVQGVGKVNRLLDSNVRLKP